MRQKRISDSASVSCKIPCPHNAASPWLNGYFVLDCKDRAEAVAWAAKNPAAQGGTVEVHPILSL